MLLFGCHQKLGVLLDFSIDITPTLPIMSMQCREILQNVSDVQEQLYNSVISGAIDNALRLTNTLHNAGYTQIIKDIVTRLLNIGTPNIMGYAYRLWLCKKHDLVIGYFPAAFKLIFNGDQVTITYHRHGLPMKLQISKDDDGDRKAWGDGAKDVNDRMKWKFITILENNNVYFKILNEEYKQYLKLEIATDNVGDRAAFGSDQDDTKRHLWYLRPAMHEGGVLFYIFNRNYNQALKMGEWQDNINDRIVWGHKGNVLGQPAIFGWKIE